MNAQTVAALRELLGREDVIEAAAKAEWDHFPSEPKWRVAPEDVRATWRAAMRGALVAALDVVAAQPSFSPLPVLSTITDDDLHTDLHPEPGDKPSEPLPPWVDGFALPPRIRVDPDPRTAP